MRPIKKALRLLSELKADVREIKKSAYIKGYGDGITEATEEIADSIESFRTYLNFFSKFDEFISEKHLYLTFDDSGATKAWTEVIDYYRKVKNSEKIKESENEG